MQYDFMKPTYYPGFGHWLARLPLVSMALVLDLRGNIILE